MLLVLVAEETTHWRSPRFGRVIFRKLDLDTVVARFTERVDFALLLPGVEHIVELLVGWIVGKPRGLLRP